MLDSFLQSSVSHYCYAFKGVFLPSGNLDGIVWKPSQGAKPAGKGLLKRYFYYKKDNLKINRQVIWLTSNENWCFLDYRYNFKGKIKLGDIGIPEDFNFRGLLMAACASFFQPQSQIKRRRSIKTEDYYDEDVEEDEDDSILEETINESKSATTLVKTNSNTLSPLNYSSFIKYEEDLSAALTSSSSTSSVAPINFEADLLAPQTQQTTATSLTSNSSHLFLTLLDNLEFQLSPSLKLDFADEEDDEFLFSTKKRKTDSLDDLLNLTFPTQNESLPTEDEFLAAAPVSTNNYLSSTFSSTVSAGWEWANPTNIFSSGLEYFFDMISHLICNQLVFQRRIFKKHGIDSELAREKAKQLSFNFDISEFPGNIIQSFFEFISVSFYQLNVEQLPTIYCIVCGKDCRHHDKKIHQEFFHHLDESLTTLLREKANNMYELVKQYIMYLLKNPNSHETLKKYLEKHLHCPFCSATHGTHNASAHRQWTSLWKMEPSTSASPPPISTTTNMYDYTKTTFEWLVDQVPFYIPPFLLSFHYANYLKTFMECLVSCWNSVKL